MENKNKNKSTDSYNDRIGFYEALRKRAKLGILPVYYHGPKHKMECHPSCQSHCYYVKSEIERGMLHYYAYQSNRLEYPIGWAEDTDEAQAIIDTIAAREKKWDDYCHELKTPAQLYDVTDSECNKFTVFFGY